MAGFDHYHNDLNHLPYIVDHRDPIYSEVTLIAQLPVRSSCSFKTVQVVRWIPNSIVPCFPFKCMVPQRKHVPFSVLKHCACQIS